MQLTYGEQDSIFIKYINMTAASLMLGSDHPNQPVERVYHDSSHPSTVAEPNWEAEAEAAGQANVDAGKGLGGPPGSDGSWGCRPLSESSPECKTLPRKQTTASA